MSQTYLAQLRDGAVSALAEARATHVPTDSLATAIQDVDRALERQ